MNESSVSNQTNCRYARARAPLTRMWLGYVQGMSDLCAPVYVVMGGDEEMTFWCFVQIMERMVRPPAQTVLLAAFDAVVFVMTETELPPRPERHEEAAVDAAAAHQCHGSGALSAPRLVWPLPRQS